jgi:hypothetical protein
LAAAAAAAPAAAEDAQTAKFFKDFNLGEAARVDSTCCELLDDAINTTANTSFASDFEFEFCGDDYESPDTLLNDTADKFVLAPLT